MTLKIKTPPMPEPWITDSDAPECSRHHYSADQLAARDAQWLALVGPVVESLEMAMEIEDGCSRGYLGAFQRKGRAALRAITEEQE